jgi:hypothetical protein
VSLKKKKSQRKAVEVTVNNKEENSKDFCLDLFQEFGLWISVFHVMSPVVLFCRIVREMRVDEVAWVRQKVEIVLLWQELTSGTVVTSCTK